jgi:hypothetical protein
MFLIKNRKFITFISIVVFLLGSIISFLLYLFYGENSIDTVWHINAFFMVLYPLLICIISFYKFRINQYLRSFEGQMFGIITLVFFIRLFRNIYQLSMEIKDIPTLDFLYSPFFAALRIVPSLLLIILLIKLIKNYETQVNSNSQIFFIFIIILIFSADNIGYMGNLFMAVNQYSHIKIIIRFLYNLLDVTILILSVWIYLALKNNKYTKLWNYFAMGAGIWVLSNIIYLISNDNNYLPMLFIASFGKSFGSLLIFNGVLNNNFKSVYNTDMRKISLNKNLLQILEYIRSNQGCIKLDITGKFEITRMTTDAKLKILQDIGFITVEKEGRQRKIFISEKGLDYFNSKSD